jgi:hypothetical protein
MSISAGRSDTLGEAVVDQLEDFAEDLGHGLRVGDAIDR